MLENALNAIKLGSSSISNKFYDYNSDKNNQSNKLHDQFLIDEIKADMKDASNLNSSPSNSYSNHNNHYLIQTKQNNYNTDTKTSIFKETNIDDFNMSALNTGLTFGNGKPTDDDKMNLNDLND